MFQLVVCVGHVYHPLDTILWCNVLFVVLQLVVCVGHVYHPLDTILWCNVLFVVLQLVVCVGHVYHLLDTILWCNVLFVVLQLVVCVGHVYHPLDTILWCNVLFVVLQLVVCVGHVYHPLDTVLVVHAQTQGRRSLWRMPKGLLPGMVVSPGWMRFSQITATWILGCNLSSSVAICFLMCLVASTTHSNMSLHMVAW